VTDYEEIQNLVARYADAVTRRDFDALATVFAPNAVWDVTGGTKLRYEGAELVPGIRSIVEMSNFLAQVHSPAIVEINGDRASSRVTALEVGEIQAYSLRFEQFGIYEDSLCKVDGRWLFTERRFTTLNMNRQKLQPDKS
jgi:hypothetical protein